MTTGENRVLIKEGTMWSDLVSIFKISSKGSFKQQQESLLQPKELQQV
jgi:hypothetical protein